MAIYHVACREKRDGNRDFPTRYAKYNGRCAGCSVYINKGDAISCTRDNENGARKTPSTRGKAPSTRGPQNTPCTKCGAPYDAREMITHERGGSNCIEIDACTARAQARKDADTFMHGAPDNDAPASEPSEKPASEVPALPAGTLENALATAILPYLEHRIRATATVSPEMVEEIVKRHMSPVTRVEIVTPTGETKDAGVQHRQFPLLVKALASGCNVWITGPAGSGKTTAVHNAAKLLGLEYGYTGSCQDQYALTGYNDAQGRYVRTPLRERYEHGGLFLWDEVDASDPNALLAFNAMLANGTAAFPDAMIDRHPGCVLAATANTFGQGASAEYVGRNRLDAAFLDRWVKIAWTVDEDLERATCAHVDWVKRVQEVRSRVASKGLRVLVTPRASYYGARLLAAGVAWPDVEAMTMGASMTQDQWRQVSA